MCVDIGQSVCDDGIVGGVGIGIVVCVCCVLVVVDQVYVVDGWDQIFVIFVFDDFQCQFDGCDFVCVGQDMVVQIDVFGYGCQMWIFFGEGYIMFLMYCEFVFVQDVCFGQYIGFGVQVVDGVVQLLLFVYLVCDLVIGIVGWLCVVDDKDIVICYCFGQWVIGCYVQFV